MPNHRPDNATSASKDDLRELLDAIREAVSAENLACYLDGMNDTRRDAEAALNRALKLARNLARSRNAAVKAAKRSQGTAQTG
ncbi:MAG TPA: hypothetical protein VFG15_03270 [Amycolatopsis sp.]|nr:hypothetical protein [Amycolatopsis sp.]